MKTETTRIDRPARRRKNLRKLGVSVSLHTLLTVLSILWMVPVFWLILSSFRGGARSLAAISWDSSRSSVFWSCGKKV